MINKKATLLKNIEQFNKEAIELGLETNEDKLHGLGKVNTYRINHRKLQI